MTALQTALLIFAVLAVIAVYLYSRRDRRTADKWNPDEAAEAPELPTARERQLDIFASGNSTAPDLESAGSGTGGTASSTQQFDEFGVGRPRRIEPGTEPSSTPIEDEPPARYAPSFAPITRTAPSTPPPAATATAATKTAPAPGGEKIVSLLIAEREGTHILGRQVHDALRAQGLEFGTKQIYHRLHAGKIVFSVASLLKPGTLDPANATKFSTPGLTLFMVLPGPLRASDAIRDMVGTAERLAHQLNAEVFDAKRQPMTPTSVRVLQQDVESWARAAAN